MRELMAELLSAMRLEPRLADTVAIDGVVPELGTPFRVAEIAAAALGVQAALIAEIWRQRTGRRQQAKIMLEAAALAIQSVMLQRVWNYPIALTEPAYPTVALYPTVDERFIMINGGYPLLRDGLLRLLNCADDASALRNVIARRESFALEEDIAGKGLCGVVVRSAKEWRAHPQGEALDATPVVEIIRLDDADPVPLPAGERPLGGLRVLDLTHVIAGPTIGKCLAEQGAGVLHIYDPTRPQIPPFDMDTGHGKRCAFLDLRQPNDGAALKTLAGETDVFVQSYRPGACAGLGFSPEALARLRPGIIAVSVSCYGFTGPWRLRPGFEQLAQAATGMAMIQGTSDNPALCPGLFPNDYITGFLAACGVLAALLHRAETGGSYHVRVSLCRTAMLILESGLLPADPARVPVDPGFRAGLMQEEHTPIGRMRYLGPVISYSETKSSWARPPVPLGADAPSWT